VPEPSEVSPADPPGPGPAAAPGEAAGLLPLEAGAQRVGWVGAGWAERALRPPSPFLAAGTGLALDPQLDDFEKRSAALAAWALDVRRRHRVRGWRDERVVIAGADVAPLFEVERAMLRPLGLLLRSVQANAYADGERGPVVWVARRADTKPIDPGLLDTLVGGGIAGFDSARDTLLRECAEEAGIPAAIAAGAVPAGRLDSRYLAEDDGLQVLHRERVELFDLRLPAEFTPRAADGEHQQILAMTPLEVLTSIGAGGWTREGAQASASLVARMGWPVARGAHPAGGARAPTDGGPRWRPSAHNFDAGRRPPRPFFIDSCSAFPPPHRRRRRRRGGGFFAPEPARPEPQPSGLRPRCGRRPSGCGSTRSSRPRRRIRPHPRRCAPRRRRRGPGPRRTWDCRTRARSRISRRLS
jgi:8-oxo-dGTP pyrophosphatase MutT (NUDIX family)